MKGSYAEMAARFWFLFEPNLPQEPFFLVAIEVSGTAPPDVGYEVSFFPLRIHRSLSLRCLGGQAEKWVCHLDWPGT